MTVKAQRKVGLNTRRNVYSGLMKVTSMLDFKDVWLGSDCQWCSGPRSLKPCFQQMQHMWLFISDSYLWWKCNIPVYQTNGNIPLKCSSVKVILQELSQQNPMRNPEFSDKWIDSAYSKQLFLARLLLVAVWLYSVVTGVIWLFCCWLRMNSYALKTRTGVQVDNSILDMKGPNQGIHLKWRWTCPWD